MCVCVCVCVCVVGWLGVWGSLVERLVAGWWWLGSCTPEGLVGRQPPACVGTEPVAEMHTTHPHTCPPPTHPPTTHTHTCRRGDADWQGAAHWRREGEDSGGAALGWVPAWRVGGAAGGGRGVAAGVASGVVRAAAGGRTCAATSLARLSALSGGGASGGCLPPAPPCRLPTLPPAPSVPPSHPFPSPFSPPTHAGVRHLVFPEGNRRDWEELTEVGWGVVGRLPAGLPGWLGGALPRCSCPAGVLAGGRWRRAGGLAPHPRLPTLNSRLALGPSHPLTTPPPPPLSPTNNDTPLLPSCSLPLPPRPTSFCRTSRRVWIHTLCPTTTRSMRWHSGTRRPVRGSSRRRRRRRRHDPAGGSCSSRCHLVVEAAGGASAESLPRSRPVESEAPAGLQRRQVGEGGGSGSRPRAAWETPTPANVWAHSVVCELEERAPFRGKRLIEPQLPGSAQCWWGS